MLLALVLVASGAAQAVYAVPARVRAEVESSDCARRCQRVARAERTSCPPRCCVVAPASDEERATPTARPAPDPGPVVVIVAGAAPAPPRHVVVGPGLDSAQRAGPRWLETRALRL
jgi:hypothetical protein